MSHCNGWQFIERWLEKRNLRQCELADYLGVSTAAITQIKNGNIRLSSGKMEKILQFFDVQEWEREEFYHEIFTARIQTTGTNRANVSESLPVTSINASRPLINFSILDQFAEQSQEATGIRIRKCAVGDYILPQWTAGVFAVIAEARTAGMPFGGEVILLLRPSRTLRKGDRILVKYKRDGRIAIENYCTPFSAPGEHVAYDRQTLIESAVWYYPIAEMILSPRVKGELPMTSGK